MSVPSLEQIADALVAAFPELSEPEQRVSLATYRLLAKGQPATADQISGASGVPHEAVAQMLAKWHGVEQNADGDVTAFWGLSLSKTRHLFRLNGRELHTWCAWDTLFLPPLLGAAAEVESVCPVPTKPEIERSVTQTFCCQVHFFASSSAAREWVRERPRTFILSVESGWEIGARKNAAQFAGVWGRENRV